MKSIKNYILESEADGKNGSYQQFVDPDTGEVCEIWVDDPDPEDEAKKQNKQRLMLKNIGKKLN